MKRRVVCIVAVLVMAVVVNAGTVWNPAGNSANLGSMAWSDLENWTNGLPDDADKAIFNVDGAAIAIVSTIESGMQVVQGDGGPGGTIHVVNGGSISTKAGSWSAIGYNDVAHLVVHEGGTFNFGQHAWIGLNAGGVGTVDISGTVTVGAMLGLGWGGGVGFVNVKDGGVLELFQMHGDGSSSVKEGSILNVETGGQIILSGDKTGLIEAYIANGRLASNGVVGDVAITVENGITTVTAIPEPATMILLGLGGLLLRKRR